MERRGVKVDELVNLIGQKDIRIYELQRDLENLTEEHEKLQKAFTELVQKSSSEAKPSEPLPFKPKEVNPIEAEKVE